MFTFPVRSLFRLLSVTMAHETRTCSVYVHVYPPQRPSILRAPMVRLDSRGDSVAAHGSETRVSLLAEMHDHDTDDASRRLRNCVLSSSLVS